MGVVVCVAVCGCMVDILSTPCDVALKHTQTHSTPAQSASGPDHSTCLCSASRTESALAHDPKSALFGFSIDFKHRQRLALLLVVGCIEAELLIDRVVRQSTSK